MAKHRPRAALEIAYVWECSACGNLNVVLPESITTTKAEPWSDGRDHLDILMPGFANCRRCNTRHELYDPDASS